jgi:hypothetical protein
MKTGVCAAACAKCLQMKTGATGLEPATSGVTGRRSGRRTAVPGILDRAGGSPASPGVRTPCEHQVAFRSRPQTRRVAKIRMNSRHRGHSMTPLDTAPSLVMK